MNRNLAGQLQVTLLFGYVSQKKFCLHILKASSEEVILKRS